MAEIVPPPGAAVGVLTEVRVTFSEPVTGVEAPDLTINDRTPAAVTGSGAGPYRFVFTQPEAGTVAVSWDSDHGIAGLGTGPLEVAIPSWSYTLADVAPPALGQIASSVPGQELPAVRPMAGSTVGALTEARVTFSKAVTGVDAADLLVNGTPTAAVTGEGAGPYVFSFAQPGEGTVAFQWAGAAGIVDAGGRAFEGAAAGWSVTRAADRGTVAITEFLAANGGVMPSPARGLRDEDFDPEPWVELTNTGSVAVDLKGWALSDENTAPGRWVLPSRTLAPGARLIVWCSGKDRRPAAGHLHTDFGLSLDGGTIALFAPDAPAGAPVSVIEAYPPQRYDYSYGAQESDGAWRYFSPSTATQANYTMPTSANPTPNPPAVPQGAPNGTSALASVLAPPAANVARGYFDEAFPLILSAEPGAAIHYTLDGSAPSAASPKYEAPLTVANTSVLRAAAFAAGRVPSEIVTHTYLFPESVFAQESPPYNNPARATDDDNPEPPSVGGQPLPVAWGTNGTGGFPGRITNLNANQVPADYGMDPKVYADPARYSDDGSADPAGATNRERIQRALLTLPALSLVMENNAMWGAGGLYPTASETDKTDRTKPCSLEMLLPEGGSLFAVHTGIDLHGNASRAPYKNPKHGFTIKFRGRYGAPKLEGEVFPGSPVRKWDKLVLRADFNSSWLHQNGQTGLDTNSQRPRGIRIRDAWSKDTFRDMGRAAGHHRYVNLFINGLFWGTYDLAEDQDADFAASYMGGEPEEYDVVEQGTLKNGDWTAYREMKALLGWTGATRTTVPTAAVLNSAFGNEQYEEIKRYLDVPWFADYMLLHFFTGHQDWATTSDYNKNWYAVRHRNGTFRYLPWDQENLLWGPSDNRVAAEYPPTAIHPRLKQNAEYRLDFADRVHRHCVALEGALRPDANAARLDKWAAIMNADAMCLESARWGDYRYQVHRYSAGTFNEVYTWNGRWQEGESVRFNSTNTNYWLAEIRRLKTQYFPVRTNNVLTQLRSAQLYPRVNAPEARDEATGDLAASRQVAAGWRLRLSLPAPAPTGTTSNGAIWFTTDGTDPRVAYDTTGQRTATAQAYAAPLAINGTTTVKARALDGTTWSALMEATFTVGSSLPGVRITELHYNPPASQGGGAAEFIEIKNTGTQRADLSHWSFSGINFNFPHGFTLRPGDLAVLVNNEAPAVFASQHPGVAVAGYFGGSLSNGGERIELRDRNGSIVDAVEYSDRAPWPAAADNRGYSLERIVLDGDSQAPAHWRASLELKGTPGRDPVPRVAPAIQLSELLWRNGGSYTAGGAQPGYVELHNPGASPVDAGGWTVGLENASLLTLPAGSSIAAQGYLLVHLAAAGTAPGLQLSANTEETQGTLFLLDPEGAAVDGLRFGPQAADLAFGRIEGQWRLGAPSPGAGHTASATAPLSSLRLNEWLADPPPGEDDWLELFNSHAALPVVLQGLELSCGAKTGRYPAVAAVAPGGWARLWCADDATRADAALFPLPSRGSTLALADDQGTVFDALAYDGMPPGKSQGRLPDGAGPVTLLPYPSPSQANYGAIPNAPQLNEILVLNVNGNPSINNAPWARRPPWVELRQPQGPGASLEGWELRAGGAVPQTFRFPAGVTLAGGAYLALWCDPAQPPGFAVPGHPNTGLDLTDPAATWLELRTPSGAVADAVSWGPQVADLSIGRSLDRGDWALLATPTRGAANNGFSGTVVTMPLKINEWRPAQASGVPEFVEIFNPYTTPIALGGLWLSDDPSLAGRKKWQVPALSFVDGGGYAVFGPRRAGRFPIGYDFELSPSGGALRLGRGNTATAAVDRVSFGAWASAAQTQGRMPDGSDMIGAMSPTPGAPNATTAGPVFLEHPRSQGVALGTPFTLRAWAEGAASYQWRRNGVTLAGQTSDQLEIPSAALENTGAYTCAATSPEGTTTSQEAHVIVLFTYADWAAMHGAGAADADDDLDGVPNGVEFVTGSDPRQPSGESAGPYFEVREIGGSERLAIEIPLNPLASYTAVMGEISPDLRPGSWQPPSGYGWSRAGSPSGLPIVRLRFLMPPDAGQQFFRLRLEP